MKRNINIKWSLNLYGYVWTMARICKSWVLVLCQILANRIQTNQPIAIIYNQLWTTTRIQALSLFAHIALYSATPCWYCTQTIYPLIAVVVIVFIFTIFCHHYYYIKCSFFFKKKMAFCYKYITGNEKCAKMRKKNCE